MKATSYGPENSACYAIDLMPSIRVHLPEVDTHQTVRRCRQNTADDCQDPHDV